MPNLNWKLHDFVKSFWEPRFPGQVPSQLAAPETLEGDTLYLEGEELKVVELVIPTRQIQLRFTFLR
jgi:hypothetical protein